MNNGKFRAVIRNLPAEKKKPFEMVDWSTVYLLGVWVCRL
jgi:hypothetical protein